ncbi:MAG: cytidine deaminase [Acidimicrobiales bacterium]
MTPESDWPALRQSAHRVATHAHAPYSGLAVGAAGLSDDGRLLAACNVENASFGLTLCAECGLVSMLRSGGSRALMAVSIVSAGGATLAPCGRCRQLLWDNGGPGLLLDTGPASAPVRLERLLPEAFSGIDLPSPPRDP